MSLDVVERKVSGFGIVKIEPEDFIDRVKSNLVPRYFIFTEESGFKGFRSGVCLRAFHSRKKNHMGLAGVR